MSKRKISTIMFMIVIGLLLVYLFLYRQDLMANPRVINPESGLSAIQFDVGFHWSTLLGMLGVLMFIAGLYMTSKKNQQYKMGFLALALNVITFWSWEFFIESAFKYYYFEFSEYDIMPKVYYVLIFFELFALVITILIMIFCRSNNKLRKFYIFISTFSFLIGLICIFIQTITNPWFLCQSLGTILILAVLLWRIQNGRKFLFKKMV